VGRTEKATLERRRIGLKTECRLLEFIRENPGLSMYEIAKRLGWSVGKVQQAVKRLSFMREVRVEPVVEGGRLKKRIYLDEREWWMLYDWSDPRNLDMLESMPSKLRKRVEAWLRKKGHL